MVVRWSRFGLAQLAGCTLAVITLSDLVVGHHSEGVGGVGGKVYYCYILCRVHLDTKNPVVLGIAGVVLHNEVLDGSKVEGPGGPGNGGFQSC